MPCSFAIVLRPCPWQPRLPRVGTLLRVTFPEVTPKSNLGKFNSVMKKIGRNVKDTAVGAVERIGAGIQGRVRFLAFDEGDGRTRLLD